MAFNERKGEPRMELEFREKAIPSTEMVLPSISDKTQTSGTRTAWLDDERFQIMTWFGFTPKTEEYEAYLSTWRVKPKTIAENNKVTDGIIELVKIEIRVKIHGWSKDKVEAGFLPDSHYRKVGEIGRILFPVTNMGEKRQIFRNIVT